MTTHIHLMATSLSSMIAEYVEEGIKHGYQWQGGGLTRIIERRLERLIKAHGYVRELDHREHSSADTGIRVNPMNVHDLDSLAEAMRRAEPGELIPVPKSLKLHNVVRVIPMTGADYGHELDRLDREPAQSSVTPIPGTLAGTLNAIIFAVREQAIRNGLKIGEDGWTFSDAVPTPDGEPVQMDRDNRAAARESAAIKRDRFSATELLTAVNALVMTQTHHDKLDFTAKLQRLLMRAYGRSSVESAVWTMQQVTELTGFTIDELWGQYESRKPAAKEAKTTRVRLGQVETESDAMRISIQRVLERLREQIGSLDYGMYEARFGKMMSEDEHWVDYTRDELLRAVVDLTRESLGWHYARAVDNE